MATIYTADTLESIIYDAAGKCKHCGERPSIVYTGHRGMSDHIVFHDCPKLAGTPNVVFTLSGWILKMAAWAV
jgi:hypothetical protein